MTLLAPPDLPKFGVVSNLDSTALQTLLDSIESEIVARRGPAAGPITDFRFTNRLRTFRLSRPAASAAGISSVIEFAGGVPTALATNDWVLHQNLMTMVRLSYGSNPRGRWPDQVQVVFTPRDDTAERKRVQVAVLKLDLAYTGWASQTTTNESRAALANYHLERAALLASFALTDEKSY